MGSKQKYNIPKSFLRWAGGKAWLLKHLDKLPSCIKFEVYHEPFVGGGAVYFHIQPQQAILSDSNRELIETYKAIKKDVESVIRELRKFQNTEDCYYNVRSALYRNEYRKAARFIFLNQTSFNGIYRVNLNGVYNVPYGYRTAPVFDVKTLHEISKLLQNAKLHDGDFETHIDSICKNDLVFLDPPYTVAHNNNGFIKYNQKLFSFDDQKRLSKFIDIIKKKKAYYILTNAAHNSIEDLFEKGDFKVKLQRASLIGGTNAKRGNYEEVIFTNIPGLFIKD